MQRFSDDSALDTVKYPFKICGMFKTPARPSSDTIIYTDESNG